MIYRRILKYQPIKLIFYRILYIYMTVFTSKHPKIAGVFTYINSKGPEIAGVLGKVIRKTPEIAGNFEV